MHVVHKMMLQQKLTWRWIPVLRLHDSFEHKTSKKFNLWFDSTSIQRHTQTQHEQYTYTTQHVINDIHHVTHKTSTRFNRNKHQSKTSESQRTERLRYGATTGTEVKVQRGHWAGHDTCASSTCLHAGHHRPRVGLGAVHLGRVEVCLTIMAANCKQVATKSCQSYSTTTHMHWLHKLPGVVLRVVPAAIREVNREWLFIHVPLINWISYEKQDGFWGKFTVSPKLSVHVWW